jgi:hypothetical protein
MACIIINGVELDCADGIGGVAEIYLTEYTNVPQGNITATSGVITAMTCSSGKKFWTFQLDKENGQFMSTPQRSVENGTLYYTFTLKGKMTAARRNALHILLQNRLMVIVKDNNGTYQLIGQVYGADVTGAEGTTGKAFGDMSGYTLTITGKEKDPANFVTPALLTTLTVPA